MPRPPKASRWRGWGRAPDIFKAIDKLGLKEALLADVWKPGALEMRCALSGRQGARVPLDQSFIDRFQQPYAVTHRSDIHAVFLKACQGNNLVTLETNRQVA